MASTPDLPWWVNDPEVLEDALRRVRDRGWVVESIERDESNEILTLDVGGLADPPGKLTALLPPGYPTVPPEVIGPQLLAEHIHLGSGVLCLPPELTDLVELIDAAVKLYAEGAHGLGALRALGSGAAEPRAEYLEPSPRHAVAVACPIPGDDWGICTFFGVADDAGVRGTIVSADGSAPASALTQNLAVAREPAARAHELLWWRTADREFSTSAAGLMAFWKEQAPAGLRRAITVYENRHSRPGKKGRGRRLHGVLLYGLVVPEEGPAHDEWHERLIVLARRPNQVIAIPTEAFADIGARVPDAHLLASKTVAIAGLGMLGGNIALDLARTGVGTLRLGDNDTVELGNLVRQPYELNDIGERKVDALVKHLRRVAPACSIDPQQSVSKRFGRAASRATTRAWLDGVDLLIMTTGDHLAELHLCDIAQQMGIPVVSGWVSLDVWGCATLITQWGTSGCRWCLDKRDDLLAQIPEPPDADELYTRGCGHPTFRGDIIDGRIAASIIGRAAVDTLTGVPGQDAFVVSTLRSDGGRVGPTTITAQLPPDPGCPICSR